MSRIRSGRGSRRDAYADSRSSRDLVTKARETAKRWEEETDDRAAPTREPEGHDGPAEPGGEALPRIEEAVDDGLRRLQQEAEQLLSATETRFTELERELRRSQASLEEHLAHRSAELVAASERQAEVADRLATEFGRLYQRFHPASVHLAELQARIKALAAELTSAPRPAEKPE
jgi:chromosome segregation ATPase